MTTLGNVSINTGKGDGIRDNTIIREGGIGSMPVLSGSSIKGMIRSTIEAVLAAQRAGEICVPAVCLGRDRIIPDGRKDDCGRKNPADPCPVCRMFGNTEQAGRVIFHDAHYSEGPVATFDRSHVALRRDTKTAAGGALLTMETLPSQVTFSGDIVLINPEPWMVGAILHTLPLLRLTGIGAKKTSGYGEVEVTIGQIEHPLVTEKGKRMSPDDYLRAWQKEAGLEEGSASQE